MRHPRILGATLVAASLGLFVWLLYDASSIVSTFHLGGVLSEAAVALAALTLVAIGMLSGLVLSFSSRFRFHHGATVG